MSLTRKLNAGVYNFARSMKDGAENCLLDGKITEQKSKIKALTKEIGNLALVRLEAGDEMSPEIMERYLVIKEAKEVIETLEKEKRTSTVECQNCGEKTSVHMKFCGICGACIEKET